MRDIKTVVSAAQILREAKAHAKGGAKPSWAGQTVYVGEKAVADWEEYESRAMGLGELAAFGKLMGV